MPASKSLLQGLKTCNRLGGEEARQVHAERAEAGEPPQGDLVRIARGRSHEIVHPKATTEIMSSEAVEKRMGGGVGEKNGFV